MSRTIEWSTAPDLDQHHIVLDDLIISFQRTLRVPEDERSHDLPPPPDRDRFYLFQASEYQHLPVEIAAKGGFLLPMSQAEAMRIKVTSRYEYAMKIFVNGINVISRQAKNASTEEIAEWRKHELRNGRSAQDYFVTLNQGMVDGIAAEPGLIQQFVTVPCGSGHSDEAEKHKSLEFEVMRIQEARTEEQAPWDGSLGIQFYRINNLRTIYRQYEPGLTLGQIVEWLTDREGVPPYGYWSLWHNGSVSHDRCGERHWPQGELLNVAAEPSKTLREAGVMQGDTIVVRREEAGGGWPKPPERLSVGVGGLIRQDIFQHSYTAARRDLVKSIPIAFAVHIVNTQGFIDITGTWPPPSPVSASTYIKQGYPFFPVYEEPKLNTSKINNKGRLRAKVDCAGGDRSPAPEETWDCCICGTSNRTVPRFDNTFIRCSFCQAQRGDWRCADCSSRWTGDVVVEDCERCIPAKARRRTLKELDARRNLNAKVGICNPTSAREQFEVYGDFIGSLQG